MFSKYNLIIFSSCLSKFKFMLIYEQYKKKIQNCRCFFPVWDYFCVTQGFVNSFFFLRPLVHILWSGL